MKIFKEYQVLKSDKGNMSVNLDQKDYYHAKMLDILGDKSVLENFYGSYRAHREEGSTTA